MTNRKISTLIGIAAFCGAIVFLIQLKGFLSINLSSFHGDEQGFGIPCSMTGSAQEQKMTHESFDALNARLVGQAAIDCGKPNMPKDCKRAYTFLDVRASALVEDVKLNAASMNALKARKQEAIKECVGKDGTVSAKGGWCLGAAPKRSGPTQGDQIVVNGKDYEYNIPRGHVKASSVVVKELAFMIENENITSISDFGAGVGQYKYEILKRFPDFDYRAYDGAGDIEELYHGFLDFFDLTIPLSLPKTDWVMSLEVGEHVPSKYEGMMIRNLDRHNCKGVVLSWGVLGQGGHGHINNHSNEYIIHVFRELGYSYDVSTTTKFRRAKGNYVWFKKSLMVFRRNVAVC